MWEAINFIDVWTRVTARLVAHYQSVLFYIIVSTIDTMFKSFLKSTFSEMTTDFWDRYNWKAILTFL